MRHAAFVCRDAEHARCPITGPRQRAARAMTLMYSKTQQRARDDAMLRARVMLRQRAIHTTACPTTTPLPATDAAAFFSHAAFARLCAVIFITNRYAARADAARLSPAAATLLCVAMFAAASSDAMSPGITSAAASQRKADTVPRTPPYYAIFHRRYARRVEAEVQKEVQARCACATAVYVKHAVRARFLRHAPCRAAVKIRVRVRGAQ